MRFNQHTRNLRTEPGLAQIESGQKDPVFDERRILSLAPSPQELAQKQEEHAKGEEGSRPGSAYVADRPRPACCC